MFGMAEINLFQKYISATFHSIGNIQNNSTINQTMSTSPLAAKPVVSFVSSHPNLSSSLELTALSDEVCMYIGDRPITYQLYSFIIHWGFFDFDPKILKRPSYELNKIHAFFSSLDHDQDFIPERDYNGFSNEEILCA
jgi:hypothetical protein